jgi:long-chain acyl-CoA synthetase
MSLDAALTGLSAARPEGVALVHARSGRTLDHRTLQERVEDSADRLRAAGLRPGERLIVEMSHQPRVVAWLWAAWRCDAVVVPLSPQLSPRERAFFTAHAGAALAVSAADEAPQDTGVAAGAALPRLAEGEGTAAILYTSGSTGDPKGVELSHRALLHNARAIARRYQLGPDTRFLALLPLFHGHGLVVTLLAPLLAGGGVILDGPFDAFAASRFLRTVRQHGVTMFSSVPAILRLLVQLGAGEPGAGPGTLRFGLSASAPLSPTLRAAFMERFGCPVGNSYGLTETSAWCSYGDPEPALHRAGAVGRPVPGTLRIKLEGGALAAADEVGEIQVRNPSLMSGYHRNPEATARALDGGWLRTGDLGRLDDEGHLFLVGRRRDVINHGGFSVYPGEVDQVLEAHPAVREAVTLERPSPLHGEVPVAFVVLAQDVEPDALREHCRDNLAPYKVPVEIRTIEELPRSATRKVRKDALRALLRAGDGEG